MKKLKPLKVRKLFPHKPNAKHKSIRDYNRKIARLKLKKQLATSSD